MLEELRAAVVAAGLTGSKVEAGLGVPHERLADAGTEKERKAAALVTRLTPCVVFWSPTQELYDSPDTADPAETRRRVGVVLSALAARGWKEEAPSREEQFGKKGTYFMASYVKQGWSLNARHTAASALDEVKFMATDDACFSRLTDDERALVESQSGSNS
ncbi:hypothetical protein ACIF70_39245 [Actinacidiphila glaucinigra]|uniref:hypothetical protein n=1 Tax=Actinacidiphila glaucinigra TaxID=235986 RepID=UPI0037C7701E